MSEEGDPLATAEPAQAATAAHEAEEDPPSSADQTMQDVSSEDPAAQDIAPDEVKETKVAEEEQQQQEEEAPALTATQEVEAAVVGDDHADEEPVGQKEALQEAPPQSEEAESAVEDSSALFSSWRYFVSGTAKEEVIQILDSHGAISKSYLSSTCTHCIVGDDADMDGEVTEAYEVLEIPVIRQEYVLDAIALGKLPSPKGYLVDDRSGPAGASSKIFSRCIFSLTHVDSHDSLALWSMINYYGGKVSPELNSRVSHLISGNVNEGPMYSEAMKRGGIKIVTPDFIIESIKGKAVCNPDRFHPRLLLLPGEKAKKVRKKRPKPVQPKLAQTPATPAANPSNQNLLTPSSVASTPPVVPLSMADIQTPKRPAKRPEQASLPNQQSATSAPTTPTTAAAQNPPFQLPQTPVSVTPQMLADQKTPTGTPNTVQHQQQIQQQQQQQMPVQQQQVIPQHQQMDPSMQQISQQQAVGQQQAMMQQQQQQQPPQQVMNQQMWQQQQQQQQLQQQQQQPGQWAQQPQFRPQMMQQPGQPQQVWQQQQQQAPVQQFIQGPGQMQMVQRPRPPPSQHMLRQQHLIQQHIATLTLEQRNNFTQLNAREKQQYLAARGLLLPNPQPVPGQQQQVPVMRQQAVTLTDQQREMLQTMDAPQQQLFLQKIQKEQRDLQMRQQMIQQQQQQQRQQQQMVPQQMAPQQVMVSQPQGPQQMIQQHQQPGMHQQQQMQWQQQQQQGQPQFGQMSPQLVRTPHTSPNAQMMSPGNGNGPPMMPISQPNQQQMRPTWSGETHPALAQVPRTPQQLQHLQRHMQQQQREQQHMDPNGAMVVGPRPPMGVPMGVPPQQQMIGQAQLGPMGQQQQQYMAQQQAMSPGGQMLPNGSNNQKTKAALANMLSSRLQQPGPVGGPMVMQQQQPMIPPVPPQHVQQQQPQPPPGAHMPMAPDGSAASRLQMMNQQLQQHQAPPPPQPQQHMMRPQQGPMMYSPQRQQQQFMMQQRMEMVNSVQHSPGVMGAPRGYPVPPRMGMQPQQQQQRPVGMPPQAPRIQFHGHDPNTRLPPDLCLLGCIFLVIDYQEDPEKSVYVNDWKKVIRQYGGEIEDAYHPRITHLLCKSQDSQVSQQAMREGKRLVTVYWLNDIIVKKKVSPPYKAVHFPLPPNFSLPCEHFLLAVTGFEGRDRDWVKDMIKLVGAKYTGCFSKHNHAIICQTSTGVKFSKAKDWKIPAVSVQWLNDVIFGNVNAEQCMHNPKYHNFKMEEPLRIDYALVPHLMVAWKTPIRVTPETYQKFKANPPARIKRKAERQRLEKEAKRLREAEEMRGSNEQHSLMMQQQYQQQQQMEGGGMMPNGMMQQDPMNEMGNLQHQQFHQGDPNAQHTQHQQENQSQQQQPQQNNQSQDQVQSQGGGAFQVGQENQNGPSAAENGDQRNGIAADEDKKDDSCLTESSKNASAGDVSSLTSPTKKESSESGGIASKNGRPEEEKENLERDSPKVVFTGFVQSHMDELTKMVLELGGEVLDSTSARLATHLVMNKLGRTITLLCALPYVKFVLSEKWIRESKRANRILDEENFRLEDEEFEEKFECSITRLLTKPNRDKLFEGHVFYLTPNISPSMKNIKSVIEHSGGVVMNHRRKTIPKIKALNKKGEDPTYIIVTCEDDLYFVEDVLKAKIPVFNTEFVISAVLRGCMDFDLTRYITTV